MFKTEQDLVDQFSLFIESFFKRVTRKHSRDLFAVKEFNSNFGIADMVFGSYKTTNSNSRESISEGFLYPLTQLKIGEKLDLQEMQNRFLLTKESTKRRIKTYIKYGYLEETQDGEYIVKCEYHIDTEIVISVEAKLKNWKKALQQAARYKRFSTYSFVLLDEANVTAACKNLDFFKQQNIGLASFNGSEFKIYNKPSPNKKFISEYVYRLNEAIQSQIA